MESLAEFYSIVKAADQLEAAYSRDAIKDSEYAEACSRLITQFKNSEKVLIRSGAITSADAFFKDYQLDCPRAYERLIVAGVPATVMHPTADSRAESVLIAEAVQVCPSLPHCTPCVHADLCLSALTVFHHHNGCLEAWPASSR